ncbi:MAG: energy-coupling factor ABC transporter ATP-binding protein [Propionibacteriaceae bacterium]|jgi:biotin transport system ATP-binding protein|nr:energy-coupling factor ABC transporter ATP-binding protein [Propionibacteriaceae bacterium]
MIHFDHVSHHYGDRQVLSEISLELTENRIGIIGGNGSGKSTLARLCNGLILPSEGQVSVHGHTTSQDLSTVRTMVGFVFQDPDLQIIMPTVAEDLAFSLRSTTLSKPEKEETLSTWLKEYGLDSHRDHPAHLLSGGQKQLLAIAAILITNPQIVVFDEPTTLLDLKNKYAVMDVISSLHQQVLVVTHDVDLLSDFDRVIVLDEGRVFADDTPKKAIAGYRAHIIPHRK